MKYSTKTIFTDDDRAAILNGERQLTSEEVLNIIMRPILAELDRIVKMQVKAVAFGKGKFNNSGIPTGKKDEKGFDVTEPEIVPIKDRMVHAEKLIKFVMEGMGKIGGGDQDKSADDLLKEMGMQVPDDY